MTSNIIYHYVYRITNIIEKKHYYGKRSSKIEPKQDLGIKYFSSSSDKIFKTDQKINPKNYKYKVVAIFKNAADAISREATIHHRFNVASSINFYNKVNQTKIGFDTVGKAAAKDIHGNNLGMVNTRR